MNNQIILSNQDAYILSRALTGLTIDDLTPSAGIDLLLKGFNPDNRQEFARLRRILDESGVLAQVLAVDPKAKRDGKTEEPIEIPALPKDAQLSDKALRAAETAAPFLDAFMDWSTRRTPMTPAFYLQSGAIMALAIAIAKRCHIHLHKPIAPNLYILWVADTSIYKKTTGMEAVSDLITAAIPHLLLPQEMSPESFIQELAGKLPANYDNLLPYQKNQVTRAMSFAAQRAILIDEASSLLGSKKKDYMQGLEELLLRGFDAGSQAYSRRTVSDGLLIVRDLCLCILGATTPAAFIHNVSGDAWETGNLARYALLYPEKRLAYQLPDVSLKEYLPPAELVTWLRRVHERLPLPPNPLAVNGDEPVAREVLAALIDKDAFEAIKAYTKALTYDLLTDLLDKRLWGNYARLPELCIKVALNLAVANWAQFTPDGAPRITLGEWARAQQIVETWRESMHRLLVATDTGEDARNETKVLDHLSRYSEGETLRDLTRRTHLPRKAIQESLASLMESGLVIEQQSQKQGPKTVLYVLC